MYSFAGIVGRIRDRLQNETSKIEGTFTMDNVQAVAQELAMIHDTEIAALLDAVFLDTATGGDLDRRALDFGEQRHAAGAATGALLFRGTSATFVPVGTVARFDALLYETTASARMNAQGEALVPAACQTLGSVGNVPAGMINQMVSRVAGVHSVTNPLAFEGGTEAETDGAFRARLLEKIRFPITSGNEYYYAYLAKQVPGIWRAKCTGTWAGPGTVKLTLLAPGPSTPDSAVIANVIQHVEDHRLIGADVTCVGATALPVRVSGRLVLAPGYAIEDVVPVVQQAFADYFEGIAFDGTTALLSYHRAIEMVFRAAGVRDIGELWLNGGGVSIPIGPDDFCTLEEVALHAD